MKRLSDEEPIEPAELREQVVRLLAGVVMLVRWHRVNKRGQCRYCGWTRWVWRFWRRRLRCAVYQAVGFASRQRLDMVWRQCLPENHETGR